MIFIVPKEDDHLLALARFLTEQISSNSATVGMPNITMVVLDDEADDASILDAREGSKITPQFIQNLWSTETTAPATKKFNLLASYVAYTATPQANYLQLSHNPLAPRNFHAALRVPSDRGLAHPRSVTYTEKKGLKNYYTGGEFYYERFRTVPGDPCIDFKYPMPSDGLAPEEEEGYPSIRWRMHRQCTASLFCSRCN